VNHDTPASLARLVPSQCSTRRRFVSARPPHVSTPRPAARVSSLPATTSTHRPASPPPGTTKCPIGMKPTTQPCTPQHQHAPSCHPGHWRLRLHVREPGKSAAIQQPLTISAYEASSSSALLPSPASHFPHTRLLRHTSQRYANPIKHRLRISLVTIWRCRLVLHAIHRLPPNSPANILTHLGPASKYRRLPPIVPGPPQPAAVPPSLLRRAHSDTRSPRSTTRHYHRAHRYHMIVHFPNCRGRCTIPSPSIS